MKIYDNIKKQLCEIELREYAEEYIINKFN
jgi:hypothetical protein